MSSLLSLGPHAGFIWAAYGVATLTLGGLIGWIYFDARRQRQLMADLDATGIRRRSARKPEKARTGKSP